LKTKPGKHEGDKASIVLTLKSICTQTGIIRRNTSNSDFEGSFEAMSAHLTPQLQNRLSPSISVENSFTKRVNDAS